MTNEEGRSTGLDYSSTWVKREMGMERLRTLVLWPTRRNLVRFVVQLRHADEAVEGFVIADGDPHAHTFADGLELLQKLEPRS